jgi:hypothetical protein
VYPEKQSSSNDNDDVRFPPVSLEILHSMEVPTYSADEDSDLHVSNF